jgi:hypothetical protein
VGTPGEEYADGTGVPASLDDETYSSLQPYSLQGASPTRLADLGLDSLESSGSPLTPLSDGLIVGTNNTHSELLDTGGLSESNIALATSQEINSISSSGSQLPSNLVTPPPVTPDPIPFNLPHNMTLNLLACGLSKAPKFDPRHPSTLQYYIQDYKIISAELLAVDWIRYFTRYMDPNDMEFILTLSEYNTPDHNWKSFIKAVYKSYPGSKPEDCYRMMDLIHLTNTQLLKPIINCEEFAEFDRAFTRIAMNLLS